MKKIFFTIVVILLMIFSGYLTIKPSLNIFELPLGRIQDYSQPQFSSVSRWKIKSIDTQVVSKHWNDVSSESIKEQISMLKTLGINYVAIGTSYDKPEEIKKWADEIHSQGMNVWFRSHWDEWEGDNKKPASLSPDDYLIKTEKFILDNKDLFKEGDSFTAAVEAEQVGVGIGRRFDNWDHYNRFLLNQILISKKAFSKIGFDKTIHTNWLSMNGWVVDNELNQDVVNLIGLIVVDHYTTQTKTIGEKDDIEAMVANFSMDLDRFYSKYEKPILIGEWGYQIFQESSQSEQAYAVERVMRMLETKEYVIGVNYWVHMGNTARIIDDKFGKDLVFREAASVLRYYYAKN